MVAVHVVEECSAFKNFFMAFEVLFTRAEFVFPWAIVYSENIRIVEQGYSLSQRSGPCYQIDVVF